MAKRKKKAARQPRRQIQLHVIPEPEPNTRSVLLYTGPGTVGVTGDGNVTMICGNCGSPLLENVKVAQFQGLVFRCNKCEAFNEVLIG